MNFEIYNDKKCRVFVTNSKECLPQKEHVDSMLKKNYKFKLDGKQMTKKELNQLIK